MLFYYGIIIQLVNKVLFFSNKMLSRIQKNYFSERTVGG